MAKIPMLLFVLAAIALIKVNVDEILIPPRIMETKNKEKLKFSLLVSIKILKTIKLKLVKKVVKIRL